MSKIKTFVLYTFLGTIVALSSGCDCGGGGTSKCTTDADCVAGRVCNVATGKCIPYTPQPGITIQTLDPNEVNVLREESDDTDPTTDGFQINVTAVAVDIEAGTEAELCKVVDGEVKLPCDTASLTDSGGTVSVTFTDFTLDYGLQTLRVTASTAEDSVDVNALALNECAVAITAPANHAALTETDDKSATEADLQYDVIASVTDVQAGNDCTLVAGGRPAVTAQPVGDVLSFSDADLPISRDADSLTLTVQCENNAGNTCQDSITVSVDLPDCVVTIDPPTGTLNAEDDEDAGTAGLQQTITVTSDECPDDTEVVLSVNGTDEPTATLTDHVATFSITLPDDADNGGASEVEATLTSPDERTGHDLVSYNVDTVLPVVTITSPADGGLLGGADDFNPATADVLEYPVDGTVSGGAEGTTITILLEGTDHATYVMTADDALNDPFEFEFKLVPFTEGTNNVSVTADDPAGNVGSDEIAFTAALAEPGIALTSPDPQADPALLACGDDTDAGTDLLQFLVCADTENVPAGDNATLSIDNGQPIQGTVTADGEVCFAIALDDGDHTLEACAQVEGFDETCSSVLDVTVDWTTPTISVESHQDGQPINTPTFDLVGGVTGTPDGADISLTVDGGAAVTVAVSDGGFVFEDVALTGEGSHDLELSLDLNNGSDADGAGAKGCSASTSLSLSLDTTAPTVGLSLTTANGTVAADGAALVEGDDLYGDCSDGFQADVLVQTDQPQDTEVRLWVGTHLRKAFADATGLATFNNILLAQGANVLTARTTDVAGNEGMGTANLTADCGCPLAVVTPEPDARLSLADDVDAGTDGVQINILADTDAAAGVVATLYLNEGQGAPCELASQNQVTDANGDATFAGVSLCAGDNTIRITTNDAGKICTIASHSVNVKLGKPSIMFANLTDGQYLNLSSTDASGAAGFQYDITVSTIDAEDGSTAKLTVDGGAEITTTVAGDEATFPAVTLCTDVPCPAAAPVLVATVTDLAGQESDPAQITVNVDRVAPVVTITKPDHTGLGLADDGSLVDAGLQTKVTVSVQDGNAGGDVVLTYDAGTGAQTATEQIATANGSVTIPATGYLDWPDGFVTASASHTDAAGNSGNSGETTFEVKTNEPLLELFDKDTQMIASSSSHRDDVVYSKADDTVPGTQGLEMDFVIQTTGLSDSQDVTLCSSVAPAGVTDTCRDGVNFAIATGTVVPSGGNRGQVTLGAAPMAEGVQQVFAEAADRIDNYGATEVATVTVDATAPTIETITLDSNTNTDNDADPNLVLGAAEDADGVADGLQASFTVTTTGAEDGQTVTLTVSPGGATLATATVSSNTATFSAGNGNLGTLATPGSLKITPSVSDAAGNAATSPPELNVITDIVAPTVTIDSPLAGLLTQASGTANGANLEVDFVVSFSDDSTLIGQRLMLSDGTTEQTLDIEAGTPSPHTFAGFPLGQGAGQTVTATLDDVAANQGQDSEDYDVDSAAPSVTFKTPATDIEYTATDDEGDGIVDGDLTRTDWEVTLSGADGTTTVELMSRVSGTSDAYVQISGATTSTDTDGDIAFNPITLGKGAWDVIARTTDASSNTFETSPIVVTINIDVPTVCLEKVGGDATCGTADDLTSNDAFLASEDEDANPGSYAATIVVVTDAEDGLDASLSVNTVAVTPVVQTASGTAAYNAVALAILPTTNTIRAEITNTQGNTGFVELTGIRAKDTSPAATFTNPAPGSVHTYTQADDDNLTTPTLLDFKAGAEITADIADIADGVDVTLACLLGGGPATLQGTLTATVSSGSVSFPAVQVPTAHGNNYSCYIEGFDGADNPISTTENIELGVDVTPPSAVADLMTCIGEASDDAACTALCDNGSGANDPTKCSRRLGNVTLFWTAPADDANDGTSGDVTAYEFSWGVNADSDCSAFSWDSGAHTGVTPAAIVAQGATQTAQAISIPTAGHLCFGARALDLAGNAGDTAGRFVYREVDFVITQLATGSTAGDDFGRFVYLEGDFDGDGRDDAVITEPKFTAQNEAGAVHVYYGDTGRATWSVSGNTAGMKVGSAITAGNFNNDAYDDLVIGAHGVASNDGRVYVYLGSATGLKIAPASAAADEPSIEADVTIAPAGGSGTWFGNPLGVGRFNYDGDDFDDIAIGHQNANAVYIFAGNATDFVSGTSLSVPGDADFTVDHGAVGWQSSLGTGDLDGNGLDDLISGAQYAADGYTKGQAYFVFNPSLAAGSTVSITDTCTDDQNPEACAQTITGSDAFLGVRSVAFDLNGDTFEDALVSNNSRDAVVTNLGSDTLPHALVAGDEARNAAEGEFGTYVANLGDVDHDGTNDFLISGGQGKALVYRGESGGFTSSSWRSLDRGGSFGEVVGGNGDFNGDGARDAIVADTGGAGTIYIIH